jgi:hypothetical protein
MIDMYEQVYYYFNCREYAFIVLQRNKKNVMIMPVVKCKKVTAEEYSGGIFM